MNSKTGYVILGIAIIIIVAVIVVVAKNKGGTNGQQTASNTQNSPTPTPTPSQVAITGCPNNQDVTQTDSNGRFKPTMDISNKVVTMKTTMGTFQISLYDKDAPKTVENFVCLVQKGYYNGIIFHRVSHGFVVQAGDPTGTGSGGTSVYGPSFEDELYADTPSYQAGYLKGVVAMANRGANTNSSQFFILLADHPELPKNYTIFGKVTSGQSVVDKIGAVPVTPGQFGADDGAPVKKITITTATVN